MQINIQLTKQKDQTLAKKIKDFHSKRYSHLSLPKLFIHAVVELMKRDGFYDET